LVDFQPGWNRWRSDLRDVVVVHYAAEYVYAYGNGSSSGNGLWRKFVHAWKKSGDRWQIITGMCAAQEPVNAPRS
jgi:hypothetical protein